MEASPLTRHVDIEPNKSNATQYIAALNDDDNLVYTVSTRRVVTALAPMESLSEIVQFEDLPAEVQTNPTETLTWAKQVAGYLLLETYAPPQCSVCREAARQKACSRQRPDGGGQGDVNGDPAFFTPYNPTPALPIVTQELFMPGSYSWV